MAGDQSLKQSRYEYIKSFEHHVKLLPNTFLVVRIDGRGFHHLSAKFGLEKPNDRRALDLMNAAARAVLQEIPDIPLAYGMSDEFSFIFDPSCSLFDRRESKILTTIVSTFTSYYIHLWSSYFPDKHLSSPMPSFDGRVVQYPSFQNLRDYLSWRQVDCHINNLYNTAFWALVQKGGMLPTKAEETLQGSSAADKNEILFCRFGMNYNDELEQFRKGSVIYRDYANETTGLLDTAPQKSPHDEPSRTQKGKGKKRPRKAEIMLQFTDLIRDEFWNARPWLFLQR
ncbi:MAG: hypothetical protein LQ341_000899 [Variospora aurantia]|nr:MAG: hypothetical protein LQ341_000899 [Variospora aurantia]